MRATSWRPEERSGPATTWDALVEVVDLVTGTVEEYPLEVDADQLLLAWSPHGERLCAVVNSEGLGCVDLATGEVRTYPGAFYGLAVGLAIVDREP